MRGNTRRPPRHASRRLFAGSATNCPCRTSRLSCALEWKVLSRNHQETGGPDRVAELIATWPPTCTHTKKFCKMRPAFESIRPDLRIGIAGLGHVARPVLAGQLAMDIGPELLYHDRNGVVPNLCSPYAGSIRKGAIGCIMNISRRAFRVVTNRDEGSGMVAEGGDCGR